MRLKFTISALAMLTISAHAADFTSQTNDLLKNAKGPVKPMIQENIQRFKSPQSDGGKEVTQKEFDTLKRFSEDMAEEFGDAPKSASAEKKSEPIASKSSSAVNISAHVAKLKEIAAINSGKTEQDQSARCLGLLAYYESLVTKTYTQKLELSARTGFFQYTGADSMANFPMVKMQPPDIELEYQLMSQCNLVYNNLGDNLGENFANIMAQVARVGQVKQKIEPRLYLIQGYVVTMNPLAKFDGHSVTALKANDEIFTLKTTGELSGTGNYHFLSIANGTKNVRLSNGFDRTIPQLIEVSAKAVDALFLRAIVLEGSMPSFTKEKHKCGLQRSKGDGTAIMSLLCDRAKNFKADEDGRTIYKPQGFKVYSIRDE